MLDARKITFQSMSPSGHQNPRVHGKLGKIIWYGRDGGVRVLRTRWKHHKSKDWEFLHRSYTPQKSQLRLKIFFRARQKYVPDFLGVLGFGKGMGYWKSTSRVSRPGSWREAPPKKCLFLGKCMENDFRRAQRAQNCAVMIDRKDSLGISIDPRDLNFRFKSQ